MHWFTVIVERGTRFTVVTVSSRLKRYKTIQICCYLINFRLLRDITYMTILQVIWTSVITQHSISLPWTVRITSPMHLIIIIATPVADNRYFPISHWPDVSPLQQCTSMLHVLHCDDDNNTCNNGIVLWKNELLTKCCDSITSVHSEKLARYFLLLHSQQKK